MTYQPAPAGNPGRAAADASRSDSPDQLDPAGALPGVDGIWLTVGAGVVTLTCRTHPDLADTCPYGPDGKVPATWVVAALTRHLHDHTPATGEDQTAPTAEASASGLDLFGREVAARCRWAMDANQGDPDNSWPDPYRIAVALVLGNHVYLRDMGPGPGYTPETAALVLARGMNPRPADLGTWISAIRAATRRPDQPSAGLWLPPKAPRTNA